MTESFQIYGRSIVKTVQNKKSSSRSILKFYLWKKKNLWTANQSKSLCKQTNFASHHPKLLAEIIIIIIIIIIINKIANIRKVAWWIDFLIKFNEVFISSRLCFWNSTKQCCHYSRTTLKTLALNQNFNSLFDAPTHFLQR